MNKHHLTGKQRLFVLDTNVLMHDPSALFRFHEHHIFLPMIVIEELDKAKTGLSEVSRNVRQTSRFLDELITNVTSETLSDGIALHKDNLTKNEYSGRLFLQHQPPTKELPTHLPGNIADHSILQVTLDLCDRLPGYPITLVSKDINLRIKAAMLGIHAEDYYNDQVLDDIDMLFTGTHELPPDFWETHGKSLDSWSDKGRTFYKVNGPLVENWVPNQYVYTNDKEAPFEAIVRDTSEKDSAILEITQDYRSQNHAIWGVNARNREQNFALNLLMDPNIDFVSLQGAAGTGKTLLTLASAMMQTLELDRYREIIVTRVTVPIADDIGFLPGTEEEKMTPWMGALMDNLEVLTLSQTGGQWGHDATQDLLKNRIHIRSLNFMRGRTFLNKFIILDEAQNLTAKQMQTLVTRAGPGSKIVCMGNLAQIDTPYLTETNSGLTNIVDRFKSWQHSGHITLTRGERSRLADHAAQVL